MNISQQGIDLIKQFEGLRLTSYRCSAGVWTCGFGHTTGVRENTRCTSKQAETWLRDDLKSIEHEVNALGLNLSQSQFDALCSFIFNVGLGAFFGSTLLKFLHRGDYVGAGNEFLKWNKMGGEVSAGLTKRRAKERELFMKG